jgi:hypothetical protein
VRKERILERAGSAGRSSAGHAGEGTRTSQIQDLKVAARYSA